MEGHENCRPDDPHHDCPTVLRPSHGNDERSDQ